MKNNKAVELYLRALQDDLEKGTKPFQNICQGASKEIRDKLLITHGFKQILTGYIAIVQFLREGAIKNTKNVCVVGCGWGSLIYALKKGALADSEFWGVEKEEDYIARGKEVFKNAGLNEKNLICCPAEKLSENVDKEMGLVISQHFLNSGYQFIGIQEKDIITEIHKIMVKSGKLVLTESLTPRPYEGFSHEYFILGGEFKHHIYTKK